MIRQLLCKVVSPRIQGTDRPTLAARGQRRVVRGNHLIYSKSELSITETRKSAYRAMCDT